MNEITGDKLRGHLETMILSSLEKGETHGLEILRRLELAGCGLLRLKEGRFIPPFIGSKPKGWSKQFGKKRCMEGEVPVAASIVSRPKANEP